MRSLLHRALAALAVATHAAPAPAPTSALASLVAHWSIPRINEPGNLLGFTAAALAYAHFDQTGRRP
jgi:hypothetical protein